MTTLRKAITISDSSPSVILLNQLLETGWYIENISQNNLGYLIFPMDTVQDILAEKRDLIRPRGNTDDHAIIIILTKGQGPYMQQAYVSNCIQNGKMDAEHIMHQVSVLYPGWSIALSSRLNPDECFSLLERAR